MALILRYMRPNPTAINNYHTASLLVLLLCFVFWSTMFRYQGGDVVAQTVPVWGDWALHAQIATGFAYRPPALWFSHHPVYYGIPFSYPFLADFISSLFIRLGFNIVDSFVIPSALTTFLLYLLVKRLYFLILPSRSSILGFLIFLFLFVFSVGNLTNKVLIPQRSMLLGFVFTIIAIIFIHQEFLSDKRHTFKTFIYGLVGGLILLIHAHSILIIMLVSLIYAVARHQISKLAVYYFGLCVTGISLYLFLYKGVLTNHFFSFLEPPFSGTVFIDGPWLYFVVLSVLSAVVLKTYTHPLLISGWLLIFLTGVIKFQPWDWDNTKLLVYASLFLNMFISKFFIFSFKNSVIKVLLALLLIPLLVYSSFLEWHKNLPPVSNGFVLWTLDDIKLAENFRDNTPPDVLVLTKGVHNDPIANLSGRQIFMGYDGWLWSYGIDYMDRKQEIDKFFSCDKDSKLLEKWSIDYIVFKGRVCDVPQARLIMNNADYWIYKVERSEDV